MIPSVSLIKTLRFSQIARTRTRRNGDVKRVRKKKDSCGMTVERMKKEAKASLFRKLKESTNGHSAVAMKRGERVGKREK